MRRHLPYFTAYMLTLLNETPFAVLHGVYVDPAYSSNLNFQLEMRLFETSDLFVETIKLALIQREC